SVLGVVGATRSIGVTSPQTLNGITYVFDSWSDGGAATHNITTASADTTYTAVFRQVPPNYATYVSQTVPGVMLAGQPYNVSLTINNTGTNTWAVGNYFLGAQNPQDSQVWGISRVWLPAAVAPGSSVTFNFTVTAPSTPGTYNF